MSDAGGTPAVPGGRSPRRPNDFAAGRGTPERAWQAWGGLAALPELDLTGCPAAVVVAPHPDDEVLGVGGTAARLAARVPVTLVAVTDGEGSHPGSRVLDPDGLAAARRAESVAALDALGLVGAPVRRLGLPDAGVAAHETVVADAVAAVLTPGAWCFASWRGDAHPDHEAVGRAAATACARTGARLFEYPVWTWHWAAPGDPAVPWEQARRIPLDLAVHERKRAATACFRTQVAPLSPAPEDAAILPSYVLDRLLRDVEVVLG